MVTRWESGGTGVGMVLMMTLISSDAEDPLYVYEWRLEQEAALRKAKGAGMTDEQVVNFVNGCK